MQSIMGMGMPSLADYSMYAAIAAAASSQPAGFVGALPMVQQPSHSSSSSSGTGSSLQYSTRPPSYPNTQAGNLGNHLHQRTMSAMAGLPAGYAGQPAQSPPSLGNSPQYGLVGASFASAAPSPASSQPSPFPNINSTSPAALAAAAAMNAAMTAASTSPSRQAMSAISSFSGHGALSNVSPAEGMHGNSPMSPVTAFTPNFGTSPALGQGPFGMPGGAAGLGVPGLFGMGTFGLPASGFDRKKNASCRIYTD